MGHDNDDEVDYLPGKDYHAAELIQFATYGKEEGATTPCIKYPLAIAAFFFAAFFVAVGVCCFVWLWPGNLNLDVWTFMLAYWITGAILGFATLLLGIAYLATDTFMSHFHRSYVHAMVWVTLACYLITSIGLWGFHHSYPSPDLGLIQPYTDLINILRGVQWQGVIALFVYLRFAMAMLWPAKAVIATTHAAGQRARDLIEQELRSE